MRRSLFLYPRWRSALFPFAALLGVGLFCLSLALWLITPDPLPKVLSWPVSPVLLDKDGVLIHARLSSEEEWCLPVPLQEMGLWLPKVVVAVEDKRFFEHGGVDMLALGRAVFQNITAGRVRSGASTITSQLVRLSVPRPRTFTSKALEFMGAWKLERTLTKDQILEYYLNRAPFGGPIRGVEAAARMYFGKRAKDLSLGEAALLVGLLKGPTAYRPDKNPKAALRRRQQIIALVAEKHAVPEAFAALAREEPLPRFRPQMPDKAWHFADLAFKTLPREGGVVRSTLHMRVQRFLEQVLREQAEQAGADVTAAGIVVENRTASIIAYVGNARFDPASGAHWVDCALAPRSPGSSLKPFVYMAAMEEGDIIPATLLADTPLRLGGEAPRNFDRRYRGPVTVHTALADSLNAPAVRVLRMLGVRRALNLLRQLGFAFLDRSDDVYGDSLVLGAGEISLLELARAYTTLANLGEDRSLLLRRPPFFDTRAIKDPPAPEVFSSAKETLAPLETYGSSLSSELAANAEKFGKDVLARRMASVFAVPVPSGLGNVPAQLAAAKGEPLLVSRKLYDPGAAFLVAEILKDPGRLPLLAQITQAKENAPVAFKTGTSFGMRDAWTAAYSPSHTVVVWLGRAGGEGHPKLVGISLAAPAAIKMLRSLNAAFSPEQSWYAAPPSVGKARVCALSGLAPSAFCPSTRMALNLKEVWRTVPCPMHVLQDGKTTLVWPPELEDFNRKRFAQEDLSRAVLIVSPMPGARYLITPGGRWQPIALKAEGVAYPVHWYLDGKYMGEQEREDKPLYWLPTGGGHSLSLLDAQERVCSMTVEVTDLGAKMKQEELPLLEE